MSSMGSLYIGVSGLKSNQSSLNTTAHNLANVDSKGYVRQQVLQGDLRYHNLGVTHFNTLQKGLGSNIMSVRQVREIFLDQSYRRETGRQAFYEAQAESTREVEDLFGELEGVQFQKSLQDLWSSIQELDKEPDSITTRSTLISTSISFMERAEKLARQLDRYQLELNKSITDQVNKINQIGEGIVALNKKISRYESSGVEKANDLRDERNLLLDELGKLAKITYFEDPNAVVEVSIEGTQFIMEDNLYKMKTKRATEDEEIFVDRINDYGEKIKKITEDIKNETDTTLKQDLIDERKELVEELENHLAKNKNYSIDYQVADLDNDEFEIIINDKKFIDGADLQKVKITISDMLIPVWSMNNTEVYNLDNIPSSAKNTDIGSLLGTLLSRGDKIANYTDIPIDDGTGKNIHDGMDYKKAVEKYNKEIESSVITSSRAKFDQLIHGIVTLINDILSPNSEESYTLTEDILDDKGNVMYRAGDKIRISDKEKAPVGMDPENTAGETLFNRKSVPRYSEKVTIDVIDKDGNLVELEDVRIYNEEDENGYYGKYSFFTLLEIEVNPEIMNDYSKLPISKNSGSGEFDIAIVEKIIDEWQKPFSTLSPNTVTENKINDYYTYFMAEIANKGEQFINTSKHQGEMVNNIDNQRMGITGVSSDEELTALIKYQHGYNAAARYVNVISEMLEHIIMRL